MSLDTWSGTAPTAVDAEELDHWLWRVMQKEKNKQMVTRLEDTLLEFVHDDSQTQLQFPPRNAFHRKVCHAVARRFRLEHRLEQHPDPARPQANPGETVRLVLIKTQYSAAPRSRLAQLAEAPPRAEPTNDLSRPTAAPAPPPVYDSPADASDGPRPATFLRRPRSADGTLSRMPLASAPAASSSSGTALKNISEEDYQKARARIFKPSAAVQNGSVTTEEEAVAQDLARVVKVTTVAKGPVEGSAGFERRRNRRNNNGSSNAQCATSDKPQRRGSAERADNQRPGTEQGKGQSRNWEQNQRAGRDGRATHDANSNVGPPSAPFTSESHVNEHNRTDLQDPDFDRRYDKWAVRAPLPPPPPPPQQVPVPIFSQLLYPYAMQPAAHLHPGGIQIGGVNTPGAQVAQTNMAQYPAVQLHHAPSTGMMFQHVSHGVTRVSANLATQQPNGANGHAVDAARQAHLVHRQHAPIPAQAARTPSPTYGLDSTVDFPPLP